MKYPVKS